MTSMYATAPAMTSMYMPTANMVAETVAAPGSMYMPAATVVDTAAAPIFAVPQILPQTMMQAVASPASYVPGPVAEFASPGFAMPAPAALTAGLTEPAKLEADKLAYEKALDEQLKKQSDAILKEAKIQKQMAEQTAKMQLEQYNLQVDEQFRMQCMQIDQEAQTQCNALEEAAITQRTMKEEQSAHALADYNKKKAMEEMNAKSYEIQKQWYDREVKMMGEYNKIKQAGAGAQIAAGNVI